MIKIHQSLFYTKISSLWPLACLINNKFFFRVLKIIGLSSGKCQIHLNFCKNTLKHLCWEQVILSKNYCNFRFLRSTRMKSLIIRSENGRIIKKTISVLFNEFKLSGTFAYLLIQYNQGRRQDIKFEKKCPKK